MRLRNKLSIPIDFSKGIDAWNKESLEGTNNTAGSYRRSHPLNLKQSFSGYMDDIKNFVFDANGNLIGRQYTLVRRFDPGHSPNSAVSEDVELMTHENVAGSSLFGVKNNTTGVHKLYRSTDVVPFVTTASYFASSCAVFYRDNWYVYCHQPTTNGQIKITSAGVQTNFAPGYAAGSGVIGMNKAIIWKERVFGLAQGNTYLFWSKATDPTVFAVPDGGFLSFTYQLRNLIVFNDVLYILDYLNNIWTLSYNIDPSVDGVLTKLIDGSSIPGFSSGNFVVSNNELYVTAQTNIYRIVNNNPIPIADSLYMSLNAHDQVSAWDIGYGLLVQTYYDGGNTDNPDWWVYHHVNGAWTRVDFSFSADETNRNYEISYAALDTTQYQQQLVIFLRGSKTPFGLGSGFFPVFKWYLNIGWFGDSNHDSFMTAYDGLGTEVAGIKNYRSIKYKLQSGPIYPSKPNFFTRFAAVIINAYLGMRQDGTTPNISPFKTTIDYIPTDMPSKVDSTLQRTPSSDPSMPTYVIPINQKARAIRFTLESEDNDIWTVFQDIFSAGENVFARPIIQDINVAVQESQIERDRSSATLYTDSTAK